jgi:hypothetical protein
LIARDVPRDRHIAEHELLVVRVPHELEARLLAHRRVRAVASDEPRRANRLLAAVRGAQARDQAGVVLLVADELDSAFDRAAELAEPIREHLLGLALRQDEDVRKSRLELLEARLYDRASVREHGDAIAPHAARDHCIRDVEIVEDLERARVNPECA